MAAIAEELPYVSVVSNDNLNTVCSKCFTVNSSRNLSRCSKCKVLYYCSSRCQSDDWNEHKEECLCLSRCSPRVPSSMARILARIILKMKRGDFGLSFNGRTINDLIDHKTEIQKDAERCEFFLCISHVLYDYLGPENMPPASEILRIFGKVVVNCFTIQDGSLCTLGTGLYLGLSAQDHSCSPDAFVLFQGAKAVLRTPNRNLKYGKNITISYTDIMQHNYERKRQLKQQYYFECKCVVCEDTQRDSLSRSVRCSRCIDGICPTDSQQLKLVCLQCGQPQKITANEAITANQEIEWILEKVDKEKNDINIAKELDEAVNIVERLSRILSHINLALAVFAQRILSGAFQLGRKDLLEKYALVSIPAYKQFLPVGHPELTVRLQMAGHAAALVEPSNQGALDIIEQAAASSLISHGPCHQLTSNIDAMRVSYRTKLQEQL